MRIEDICRKIVELGERKGADQVEGFVVDGKMLNAYWEAGGGGTITSNQWIGIGVKIAIGKRIGYVSGIYRGDESLENIVSTGIKIARVSPPDKNFESLPEPRSIGGVVEDIFDEDLANIEPQSLWDHVKEIVEESERREVRVMRGLLRANIFEFHVMNSLGVDFHHKGTNVFAHFLAKKGMGEGVVKRYSTSLKGIDWREAGKELYEKTIVASEAKPFKGNVKLEVIIEPMELAEMLLAILAAVNGENINKRRSPWIGKIGQKVASEKLTIIDDGRMRGGIRSALADDEGVPTTRKPIIEKGVLRTYLYDYYNAKIAGAEPMGNGFRRGARTIENMHRWSAGAAPSNVEIVAGNKSVDEMIHETEKGLFIRKFAAPYVDFMTGNFGLEIRNAILIENGDKKLSIKHALLIGNIYEMINNIIEIGRERKLIEIMLLPAMKFGGLQVVGT